jgi:hypothetical protein
MQIHKEVVEEEEEEAVVEVGVEVGVDEVKKVAEKHVLEIQIVYKIVKELKL